MAGSVPVASCWNGWEFTPTRVADAGGQTLRTPELGCDLAAILSGQTPCPGVMSAATSRPFGRHA